MVLVYKIPRFENIAALNNSVATDRIATFT